MSEDKGVFCGLESIANKYLLDPTWMRKDGKTTGFGHKENCLQLKSDAAPNFFSAERLITEMFDGIKNNILTRKDKREPSGANWDFNRREKVNPKAGQTGKGKASKKPEVTLERAIIQARRKIYPLIKDRWTYQMPVATGLFGPGTDKSSNIDLVRKTDLAFDLIELKVGSNNPIYAAVEILQYGLAYAVSREYAEKIGYDTKKLEILRAKQIRLCVLAPPFEFAPFYDNRYNLAWLENGINIALQQFSKAKGFCMLFEFQELNFKWDTTNATDSPSEEQLNALNKAVDKIKWKKAIT